MLKRPDASSLLVLIACMAAAAFWTQELSLRASGRDYVAAFQGRRFPFLLTGLQLQIPSLVTRVSGTVASDAERRIIIALSDSCTFCHAAKDALCSLVSQPLARTDQILLVSYDGTGIPAHLERCARAAATHAEVAVALVANKHEFGILTGILATPSYLVADRDWRIVRTFPADVGSLRGYLSAPAPSATIHEGGSR